MYIRSQTNIPSRTGHSNALLNIRYVLFLYELIREHLQSDHKVNEMDVCFESTSCKKYGMQITISADAKHSCAFWRSPFCPNHAPLCSNTATPPPHIQTPPHLHHTFKHRHTYTTHLLLPLDLTATDLPYTTYHLTTINSQMAQGLRHQISYNHISAFKWHMAQGLRHQISYNHISPFKWHMAQGLLYQIS